MDRKKLTFFTWSTLTLIFGGMLPDVIGGASIFNEWFGADPWPRPIRVLIGLAILSLFIFFANQLWKATEQLLPVKEIKKCSKQHAGMQCLLIAPSTLDNKNWEYVRTDDLPTFRLKNEPWRVIQLQNDKEISEHITALRQLDDKGPNWLQLLRATEPHIDTLKKIVLLATKDVNDQIDELKEFILHCCPGNKQPDIQILPLNDKGEDMDYVYKKTNEAIADILEEGFNESHILIDITGGQKPTSVAMSLSTLHYKKIKLQYIPTDGEKDPVCYDLVNPSIGTI